MGLLSSLFGRKPSAANTAGGPEPRAPSRTGATHHEGDTTTETSTFSMEVDERFFPDRRPAVTGKVRCGVLQVGDAITIVTADGQRMTGVAQRIENQFRKPIDKATRGQDVAVFLGDFDVTQDVWFKSINPGDMVYLAAEAPEATAQEKALTSSQQLQSATVDPNLIEIVLPDRMKRHMDAYLRDPADRNGRIGSELMGAGRFEEALPRLVAHAAQTKSYHSFFLAAVCCSDVVKNSVRSGTTGEQCELVILAGIDLVNVCLTLIESDPAAPRRGEPHSLRGGLFLIKAQLERDEGALDAARWDYEKAIALGSTEASNLRRWKESLASVATVRDALFR